MLDVELAALAARRSPYVEGAVTIGLLAKALSRGTGPSDGSARARDLGRVAVRAMNSVATPLLTRGEAIGAVLGYAVGVAVSPVPIAAVILMMFSERSRSNSLSFMIA